MARKKSFTVDTLLDARKKAGMNQSEFWHRFGVTQSGGSRYESGRNIPMPSAMLLWLAHTGRISDKDLADALKAVKS
jgi:transcriptional regulator with XRE-family HTH domain